MSILNISAKLWSNPPGTYAVRAETALECSADLALVVYVEECQQRINQQQAYADEKAFDSNG